MAKSKLAALLMRENERWDAERANNGILNGINLDYWTISPYEQLRWPPRKLGWTAIWWRIIGVQWMAEGKAEGHGNLKTKSEGNLKQKWMSNGQSAWIAWESVVETVENDDNLREGWARSTKTKAGPVEWRSELVNWSERSNDGECNEPKRIEGNERENAVKKRKIKNIFTKKSVYVVFPPKFVRFLVFLFYITIKFARIGRYMC